MAARRRRNRSTLTATVHDDDLDQLVSQLNRAAEEGGTTAADRQDRGVLAGWLRAVREADGSDLLLVTGAPPTARTKGRLVRLSETALDADDIDTATLPFASSRISMRASRVTSSPSKIRSNTNTSTPAASSSRSRSGPMLPTSRLHSAPPYARHRT